LVGWLVFWLLVWLVGWLVGWFVGWFCVLHFYDGFCMIVLNVTHKLLVDADDVNILGQKHTYYTENTEALVFASKEIGLGVNAEKTMYLVMSRGQNAGQNRNIKMHNKSNRKVEEFKYF
jgi:hypothetical protein